ncbi:hypothetical protein CC86DRAFT_180473 [Ophiobolus disseminans]|uniref:Zinc finger PHD-type domain-containing protein n=1 Tax=Ophiobolus disseminans TaxID=1469910 RepID=A0A6A7ABJ0_9PLEO|nr:hypothetical protein CC86DRAFT_180473 [Ophiobolus disseminans]
MAQYKTPQSQSPPNTYSPKQYGVFEKDEPDEPGAEMQLVHMATNFNSAYEKLCEHAGDKIGQRPDWGATKEVTSKTYDILSFDGKVRLRYQIALMRSSGHNEAGDIIWTPEHDWLTKQHFNGPKDQYGMVIDLECHDKTNTKNFLVGGYSSPGEAADAMKQSAVAYLAQNKGARMFERSIELVNEQGEILQRYQVVKARWQYGEFVKEQAWLEKEAKLRLRDEGYHSFSDTDASGKTHTFSLLGAYPPSLPSTPSPKLFQNPAPVATKDAQPILEDWCTCHSPDNGDLMICCENNDCAVKWYHGRCVGLKKAPASRWWCAACAPIHAPGTNRRVAKGGKKSKVGAGTGAGVVKRRSMRKSG